MKLQTVQSDKRFGFTLIELMVVIGILSIVGVLIIPSVRTLNEDRKVRDTARVVGAIFSSARARAAVDGSAGVEIVSVPSNPGVGIGTALRYNAPNMGLVIYRLRGIPAYVGDSYDATAIVTDVGGEWQVKFLLGNDVVAGGIASIGDSIELNGCGVQLEIIDMVEVTSPPNDPTDDYLVLHVDSQAAPNPTMPTDVYVPFRIHRQPVRVESSAVRLPNNLFLNMALSGHGTEVDIDGMGNEIAPPLTMNQFKGRQFRDFSSPPAGHPDASNYPVFETPLVAGEAAAEGSTKIWFAADGSVSHVTTRAFVPSPATFYIAGVYDYPEVMQKPTGPINILMCNGNGDDVDLNDLDSPAFLKDPNNLWITINHRTGSVSMGKMAQVNNTANPLNLQLKEARELARNRRSANP